MPQICEKRISKYLQQRGAKFLLLVNLFLKISFGRAISGFFSLPLSLSQKLVGLNLLFNQLHNY